MKKAKAAAAAAAAMHSSSSSIDSSNYPNCPSPSSSASSSSFSLCPTHNMCSSISLGVGGCGCHFHDHQSTTQKDLSTDLKLGLSISPPCNRQSSASTTPRELKLNWPPIKPLLRSTLEAGKVDSSRREERDSFFVKVYMEGIPIGRKLDLFAHDGYNSLIKALGSMFHTTILDPKAENVHPNKDYILTYEDKEGDWMMVGDVPWEMFLNTVTRLKITRANGW